MIQILFVSNAFGMDNDKDKLVFLVLFTGESTLFVVRVQYMESRGLALSTERWPRLYVVVTKITFWIEHRTSSSR